MPTKIGGEPPFELTLGARRISTLRAHMRFYFRVGKHAQMAEIAAIYDELVTEPFAWLKQTGYVAATAPALARARARFDGSPCYIELKSCAHADDVAERSLDVAVQLRGPSRIQLTFPPASLDRDHFIDLCARLPGLACATAGHYLDVANARADVAKRIMDAALAHPGLELPATPVTALAANWICGVNWLTAVGATARALLGANPRGAGITVHRAGDAIVIQAGARPELAGGAAYKRVLAYLDRPDTVVGLATTIADTRVNDWHRRHC